MCEIQNLLISPRPARDPQRVRPTHAKALRSPFPGGTGQLPTLKNRGGARLFEQATLAKEASVPQTHGSFALIDRLAETGTVRIPYLSAGLSS